MGHIGPMGLIGHIGLIRFSYNNAITTKKCFYCLFVVMALLFFKRVIWLYFDNYLSKIDIAQSKKMFIFAFI